MLKYALNLATQNLTCSDNNQKISCKNIEHLLSSKPTMTARPCTVQTGGYPDGRAIQELVLVVFFHTWDLLPMYKHEAVGARFAPSYWG